MKYKSILSGLWPESIVLRISYLLGITIYVFLSFYFYNEFVPEVVTDTISYLNVAQKYSSGNFSEALNAYWSPLISWLLIPFLWLGIDPFTSLKIFHFLLGLGFLILVIKIIDRFKFTIVASAICFLTFCLFSFFYQASSSTPDFLSACLACVYIFLLINPDRHGDKFYFVKIGTTAALCFFAKSYFLAFFTIQFFIFTIWDSNNNPINKKTILLNALKIYFVFFTIIGIWVSLLSFKYQKFIISSSGPYNFSLPAYINGEIGLSPQYYSYSGLLPPPDAHSASSWVDPTYYPLKDRNPFQSWENFRFQLEVIKHNFSVFLYLFKWFSYFGLFILLIVPYLIFISNNQSKTRGLIFIISAILYLLGYVWFFFEERYILSALFMMIIGSFFAFDDLCSKYNFPLWMKTSFLILVSVCFLKNPLNVWRFKNINLPEDRNLRDAASKINNVGWLKNKRIASTNYQYGITSYIALMNNGFYYGSLNEAKDDQEENITSLEANQIDYYFCYGCNAIKNKDSKISNFLEQKPIMYKDKSINLVVYKLR